MVKREIELHIPTYLYKYLTIQYDIEDKVVLSNKFIFNMPSNSHNVGKYFEKNKANGKSIILEMWNPSTRKGYAFCKAMEREFNKALINFTDGYVRAGAAAKEAVELFLDIYEITEYDFKFETAYKKWVRRDKEYHKPVPVLHG